MIIGAMNNPHKEIIEQIHSFGEMNFDYLELTLEYPHASSWVVQKQKKRILDALSSYNLGLVAHFPWYFSISHPYEGIQKATNKEFEEVIKAAASLGAKKAVLHAEASLSPSLQSNVNMVANTIKNLKSLKKYAEAEGVNLLIENTSNRACTIKEFKKIFSEVDIKMALDIGHASLRGGAGFEEYVREFSKKVAHVHLHDNFGFNDDHLPLGAGKMDVEAVVAKLKAFYDSTITLEVHSPDPHYLKYSRDMLEILWYGKKKFEDNKDYLYPDGYKPAKY